MKRRVASMGLRLLEPQMQGLSTYQEAESEMDCCCYLWHESAWCTAESHLASAVSVTTMGNGCCVSSDGFTFQL